MRRPLLAIGAAAAVVVTFAPPANATTAVQTGLMSPVLAPSVGKNCTTSERYEPECNPAGHAVNQLPDGRILYWSGLEGLAGKPVTAWGSSGINSKAGILDLRGKTPKWTFGIAPKTNPDGYANSYFFGGALANNDVKSNDGDLFCGDFNFLADGRILLAGGQALYQDPALNSEFGAVELGGLNNTRIFDPKTNKWTDHEPMKFTRWYPTVITQPDGSTLVVSGTSKLIKPIYTEDPLQSYSNVYQMERWDPRTKSWTTLPSSANKSLPLYARLHLLPDGRSLYPAMGQTFNTGDFKKDAATWHFVSAFDPKTNSWTDLGINDIGGLPLGYRGTGATIMLPLKEGDTEVKILSFGGDLGTWPGTSFGVLPTTLTTVGIGNNNFTSRQAGSLHDGRWYSDGVLLPTGEVLTVNGSTSSELHHPGLEIPNLTSEIWNPKTEKWTRAAAQVSGRTYHSSAMLLADGRVLVGGHAPPPFMYSAGVDTFTDYGFGTGYPNSTFQIFTPPNLFYGKRPVITGVNPQVRNGQTLTVNVDRPQDISKVVLIRNPSVTHLFDADQRSIELKVVERTAKAVKVEVPGNNLLPPGPYMLFANVDSDSGEIPSVSRQVFVGTKLPAAQVQTLKQRAAELTEVELKTDALKVPLTPNPDDSAPGVRMPGSEKALIPATPIQTSAGRRRKRR
jgi:hypothetical protein